MRIKKNQNNIAITLALILLTSTLALGQDGPAGQAPPSTKGAVIKGKAPVNKNVLRVKLPRAEEATLPNGMRVVLLRNNKVPTFSMQMVILSGGLSDPTDYRGLSTFTAGALRDGTATRSSKEIAEQIDSLGATLFASSSLSGLTSLVSASGLAESLDQVLEIFSDVIRNPGFSQAEVDKYKSRLLQQQMQFRTQPQFLADEQFGKAIYGNHPAALAAPPVDSIKKMSPPDLIKFHSTYYRPNNAIFAIVGDVTMKEVTAKLQKAFGSWQKGDVPAATIPQVPAQSTSKIVLIDRPGSVQTILQLGTLGIERTSPDYFAVLMANRILGGGPSGRLFLNLREAKGYTYGAYSNFNGSKYPGTWQSSAQVRTDVTGGAMKEFLFELDRLRDQKVDAEDLENAKRAIIGGFALSLESPQNILANIINQKLYSLPADYWDTYPQHVAAITAEDVQRVAQKYIDKGHLQIVAVGDASKAREALAPYGKVEVYDADGKPVGGGTDNNK